MQHVHNGGGLRAASELTEIHHRVPRCLLGLHGAAYAGELDGQAVQAWLTWEDEAGRWGVPVEIGAEALAELVECSTVLVEREEHRRGHESDFQRWGRRGGLATLRLYGAPWFTLLALRRWGKITAEALAEQLARMEARV